MNGKRTVGSDNIYVCMTLVLTDFCNFVSRRTVAARLSTTRWFSCRRRIMSQQEDPAGRRYAYSGRDKVMVCLAAGENCWHQVNSIYDFV